VKADLTQDTDDATLVSGRQVLALAIPALGALLAEPLFVLADSAIVGHLGPAQLGGLGPAGAALNTPVNVVLSSPRLSK
jgi:Na+-driven multidrug efflux pump